MTPDFKLYLQEQNTAAVRLTCVLCATLLPAGSLLDWMTHRPFVAQFLILRLIAAAISLGVLGLSRLEAFKRSSYLLIVLVILACTGAMELMIWKIGPAASTPYYAGLNLCILGSGLVYVWSGRQAFWVCLIVLLMWLLPALWTRPKLYGDFFNNLYFLVLTSIIAVAANDMRYRLARREYQASTALAQASADLQASLERIKELDRLKNQFFTNISHELRTPLALITAPVEDLLLRGNLPDAQRATLQVIQRNALRLHRLIDGLLDLARLEADQLRLRVTALDLRGLIEGVVAAFQPAAESMGLKLVLDLPPPPSSLSPTQAQKDAVFGDSDKLEVVLTNLLGNALKFTDAGGVITVKLGYVGGEAATPRAAEISVADTGMGIPLTEQAHIFERFRRVESPDRKQGGAGIGLALVKELVELHGGTVRVASELGKGACFTIRLRTGAEHLRAEILESRPPSHSSGAIRPVPKQALAHVADVGAKLDVPPQKSSQSLLPVAPWTSQARPHVLVAEDNDDLRGFLSELLHPYYHVVATADGQAALDLALAQPPDLILTDIMMPNLSGIELCNRIKGDLRLRTVPVILLTARSGVDETVEGFSHGADDYLVKPFSPRELLARVAVQLKLRRLSAQVANAARLSAVGTLAAGVAHEIKNPLNAISTGAAALLKRGEATGLQKEVLEMIEECVGRISEITTALTDHARPADGEGISVCDLRQGLETTLRLLADRLRDRDITILRNYHTDRLIIGRPRQLNQVFLNLLDNAVRASPQGARISLSLVETAKNTVLLSVSDEGSGIPPENRDRIFDPFFTTRPPGEGTGLGLYLSRQIVEAHGGTMRADNLPGGGCEFTVELPVSVAAGERELPTTEKRRGAVA